MASQQPAKTPPTDPRFRRHMATYPRGETAPELGVRRLLHAAGLRYRVHLPVPGMPRRKIDIAFTRQKLAVFIDGCFWHACPEHGVMPKANQDWWRWKLQGNVTRDSSTNRHLVESGWRVLRFWEHEPPEDVAAAVIKALEFTPEAPK